MSKKAHKNKKKTSRKPNDIVKNQDSSSKMNTSNSTEVDQFYAHDEYDEYDAYDTLPYWHSIGLKILIVSLLLRLAALLFVGMNAGYLRCTRGLGSVRILKSVSSSFPERCCKTRSSYACNVMVLIHVTLLITEMMTAVILTCLSHTLCYWFWLLVFCDYFFISCTVCSRCIIATSQSHAHVGCLHALSAFELVNLIIFWILVPIMAIYLPFLMFGNAFLFGWASIVISYFVLLYGAWRNYKRFRMYRTLISKSEATEKMKRILEDRPSIEWYIKWNQSVGDGKINYIYTYLVVLTFCNSYIFLTVWRECKFLYF